MAYTNEIVLGSTLKQIVWTILDAERNVRDLTGGTVYLQGVSGDLPTTTINALGTLTDPANGVATWSSAGTLISDLSGKDHATFTFRVKFTDVSGKFDWTPADLSATFVPPPAV